MATKQLDASATSSVIKYRLRHLLIITAFTAVVVAIACNWQSAVDFSLPMRAGTARMSTTQSGEYPSIDFRCDGQLAVHFCVFLNGPAKKRVVEFGPGVWRTVDAEGEFSTASCRTITNRFGLWGTYRSRLDFQRNPESFRAVDGRTGETLLTISVAPSESVVVDWTDSRTAFVGKGAQQGAAVTRIRVSSPSESNEEATVEFSFVIKNPVRQ